MAATLLIRADASPAMGTGHVMRCLALAQEWQASGGHTALLGHIPVAALRRRIEDCGVELHALERPHPDPADLAATLALLDRIRSTHTRGEPTWAALDGYHFDASYQDAVGRSRARLLVVDDLARLPRYRADIVLNQNPGADQFDYPCDPRTLLLLGPRFALLRPEFAASRCLRRAVPRIARKILVTLGGADPPNATSLVLRALAELPVDDWSARVIVGAANPHQDSLRRAADGCGGRVELLDHVDDLAACMAWADVAVSAAGGTCYELACMRLPALLLVIADNQEPPARAAAAQGTAVNLGPVEHVTPGLLVERLAALCRDQGDRRAMAEAGARLVDGHGAARVAALMQALDGAIPEADLALRPAEAGDVRAVWRLASDPAVRRASLSPGPIPWETHAAWFQRRLSQPEPCFWLLDVQGLSVGQIRYDRVDDQTAQISYCVAGPFRRRGLGVRMLRETLRQACSRLAVQRVHAVVRGENEPSARALRKAGFAHLGARHAGGHACQVFQWTAEVPCA